MMENLKFVTNYRCMCCGAPFFPAFHTQVTCTKKCKRALLKLREENPNWRNFVHPFSNNPPVEVDDQ